MLLGSCAKKDIAIYSNDPRLFFQIPGSGSVALRDSLIYSFPAKPNVGEQDTLWFKACIMGETAPYDREIGIKINTISTAREGVNFKFERKVLPADSFSVRVPLVIYRKGLKDTSVRLEFEVAENKDFKVGYERYKKAIFIWGDKFLKPDIWDKSNYKSAFGEFTQTRYAFILKACNITELPDPMNLPMLGYYNAMVRKALLDYNSTPGNTPLTDELGAVGFPIYTGIGGAG
jgi:hypothetical protein